MPEKSPKLVTIDGKEYTFELTVASHRRVKDACGVSLPDCITDISGVRDKEEREKAMDGFYALMRDIERLPVVAYAMILPQLEKNNVTKERFEEIFDGKVFGDCTDAVTQALIDFFLERRDQRGQHLRTAVEMAKKAAKIDQTWQGKATAEMDRRLAEMEKAMNGKQGQDAAVQAIRETLTTSSTILPESLASILVPSP